MANEAFGTRRRLRRQGSGAVRPRQGQQLLPRLEDLSVDQIIALMRPAESGRPAASGFSADDRAFTDDRTDASVPLGFPLAAPSTPFAAPAPLRSEAFSGLQSNAAFDDGLSLEAAGAGGSQSIGGFDPRRSAGLGFTGTSLAPEPTVSPLGSAPDINQPVDRSQFRFSGQCLELLSKEKLLEKEIFKLAQESEEQDNVIRDLEADIEKKQDTLESEILKPNGSQSKISKLKVEINNIQRTLGASRRAILANINARLVAVDAELKEVRGIIKSRCRA